ncbi:amidohydrolase [Mesorhizobium sp. NZP2298]|uniref:amidohydrolase n=1 Tax=Mesorhizobium sp. NZP2298 TaxID=2483403 RepID=UPI001554C1DC|nr:amidohydrolase [Mesorhizobium sp. NZP2298]QKC98405.1 amidohydrolase [Mesorhizobium sp. NZP2298]
MFLTNQDMIDLIDFRHELHRHPELSGEERDTARRVLTFLAPMKPDRVISGLGGHGIAAIFEGAKKGRTLLFRSELDALPIEELTAVPYRSTTPGKAHLCGHDGHTAALAALGRGLARQRPASGRVVLMFQPAEENGAGAAAVIADPRFGEISPDLCFSFHNMPGIPLGKVALAEGPANCASRGMKIVLDGKTAHASSPEHGTSPMRAVALMMSALTGLGVALPPAPHFAMATVTHATMGEPTFGVAPGHAEIWVTLRTLTDDRMVRLCGDAEALARDIAEKQKLILSISYADIFSHCENAPEAVEHLGRALDAEGISHDRGDLPMRGSEDFGRFGAIAPAAMFLLGAGENVPSLHNPDYEFPDTLIETGARIFMRVVRDVLG